MTLRPEVPVITIVSFSPGGLTAIWAHDAAVLRRTTGQQVGRAGFNPAASSLRQRLLLRPSPVIIVRAFLVPPQLRPLLDSASVLTVIRVHGILHLAGQLVLSTAFLRHTCQICPAHLLIHPACLVSLGTLRGEAFPRDQSQVS